MQSVYRVELPVVGSNPNNLDNLVFCYSLSPSAKEAVPALSRMSPEKQQENHRHESHDLASAMRMAGLMAMAAPLLIDEPTENSLKYSERSWVSLIFLTRKIVKN